MKLIIFIIVGSLFSYWTLIEGNIIYVPFVHVISNAVQQPGFVSLMLFGSKEDKHNFAHGYYTKYGKMTFDSDKYLQVKGWSERNIHRLGFIIGFSDLKEK